MFEKTLLTTGLIFPVLSALTLLASLAARRRTGRYVSPVFIPCVGPLLLTGWLVVADKSWWFVPVVWLGDVGTVAFLIFLPRLIVEWWQLSVFTRLRTLVGSQGSEWATLTFHRGGRYLLRKTWERARGEFGIVALSETGVYRKEDGVLVLESDHGLVRRLRLADHDALVVAEDAHQRPELQNYSLAGWRLSG